MSNDVDAVDHEKADELMGFALEYYMKRRDVVLKKLTHAQNATQRSRKMVGDDRLELPTLSV